MSTRIIEYFSVMKCLRIEQNKPHALIDIIVLVIINIGMVERVCLIGEKETGGTPIFYSLFCSGCLNYLPKRCAGIGTLKTVCTCAEPRKKRRKAGWSGTYRAKLVFGQAF